jgi:hypothetical protein
MNSSPQDRTTHFSWKPLILTNQTFDALWKKFHNVPLAMRPEWEDKNKFFQYFNVPTSIFYEIGDLEGLASLVGIIPNLSGVVDFVMFDKLLMGREETFHGILEEMFDAIKAARLTAIVPITRYAVRRSFLRLGFEEEGRMRNAFRGRRGLEDITILGLLREEVGRWEGYEARRAEGVGPAGETVLPGTEDHGDIQPRDMDKDVVSVPVDTPGELADVGPDSEPEKDGE